MRAPPAAAAALAAVAVAAALALASGARAGEPASNGAFAHEGLFGRLAIGLGYTRAALDHPDEGGVASGLGLMGSFAVGGVITGDLALHLDLFGMTGLAVDVAVDADTAAAAGDVGEDGAAWLLALGAGVTWYAMPANVYFGLSLGACAGRVQLLSGGGRASDIGFAFSVIAGKEFWVGPEWGIGAAAQLIYGQLPMGDDGDATLFGVGLLLTTTYD